jgi:exodeoxyribonuclease VII small subunit
VTTPAETPRFEDALKQLEDVVARLEKGELRLEDSLALYEQGIGLARLCHAKLEEAEGRIEVLIKDARGEVATDAKGQPKTKALTPDGDDEVTS